MFYVNYPLGVDLRNTITLSALSEYSKVPQSFNIDSNNSISSYSYNEISGVPDYSQEDNNYLTGNACVPTSAANVLMYWDKNGYGNMVFGSWQGAANLLATSVYFDYTPNGGVTKSKIVPGLKKWLTVANRGYGNYFSISRDSNPSFNTIKGLVDGGDPSMMSVHMGQTLDHNVTIVGYEVLNNYTHRVIVHDNYKSTPKQVYVLYESLAITDVYKIIE